MLTEGKMVKGGINNKPKGERPPAPPKQNKKDLEKLYVDAIRLINQLEEEKIMKEYYSHCQACGKKLDLENEEYHRDYGTCDEYCYMKLVGLSLDDFI